MQALKTSTAPQETRYLHEFSVMKKFHVRITFEKAWLASRSSQHGMYRWFLFALASCAGLLVIRRTKRFWIKLLFPVGCVKAEEDSPVALNNAHPLPTSSVQVLLVHDKTRLPPPPPPTLQEETHVSLSHTTPHTLRYRKPAS